VLERSYPSVPRSWYLYIFLANFAGAVVLLTLYPVLQLPVWGLFLAICIAVLFLAPVGVR
jgi:VIT1/CCC1 family predicted Fe2+/Mn2+ transporter